MSVSRWGTTERGSGPDMVTQPEVLDAHDEDREVVSAFQAGDEEAFGRIVRTHYPMLLARARRRLQNTSDAEDAVQETFLRAYLALDRFAGEFRLGAWLNRILANTCADACNRRMGEVKLRDRLSTRRDDTGTPDEVAGDPELRRVIQAAIASLPESYRVAFVLREIEEKPYAEVAETMAVTEENARARVHRARSSLARTLRNATASLGVVAVPFRLLSWRRHGGGGLSVPQDGVSSSASSMGTLAPSSLGPFNPASLAPAGSSSLGSLASSVPQTLGQLTSGPLSQNLLASVPDISRAALPLASTALVTLAAGAAAVLPSPVGAPAVAAAPSSISATSPVQLPDLGSLRQLAALGLVPDSTSVTRTPTGDSGSGVSGSSSGSSSSADSTGAPAGTSGSSGSSAGGSVPATTSNPALVGSPDQWGWVGQAASGTAPTAASSGSQPSSLAPCPYAQSFPIYAPGPVPLVAPEPSGAVPTGSLATGATDVASPGDAFEANGAGPASDGVDSGTVQASMGVCPEAGDYPMLVANLASTNPGSSAAPVLQVEAALVSSFSSSQGTDTYYRGVGVWLSGPDRTSPAVPLVAEVVQAPTDAGATSSSATPVSLLVAFYGPVNDLVAPGASCAASPTGTGSSGTTTSTSGGSPSGSSGSGSGTSCATADSTEPQSAPATAGTATNGSTS